MSINVWSALDVKERKRLNPSASVCMGPGMVRGVCWLSKYCFGDQRAIVKLYPFLTLTQKDTFEI